MLLYEIVVHQHTLDAECMGLEGVNPGLGVGCNLTDGTGIAEYHDVKIAYALLNFVFGCLQRGQRQSSGRFSKATPSCSAGS